MKIGDLLYNYRSRNRLTLDDFSKRSGLSRSYISFLEHGNSPGREGSIKPSYETYQKVAKGMGIPVEQLLDMVDDTGVEEIPSVKGIDWTAEELEQINQFCRYLLYKRKLNEH